MTYGAAVSSRLIIRNLALQSRVSRCCIVLHVFNLKHIMIKRKVCSFVVRAIVYIQALVIFCCVRKFFEQLSLMPQELNVLRCYSCKMYQVHIVSKAKKWQCKICNEKQSTRMVYLRGTGAECRNYVQAQNMRSAEETARAEENFQTAIIEGWGLDCEADNQMEDPCDCSRRKLAVAKFSHKFSDHWDDTRAEKENRSLSCNPWKRPRLDDQEKRSCSLPVVGSLSRGDNFRSQSFPCTSDRPKGGGKWEKFLEGGDEGREERRRPRSQGDPRANSWGKQDICEVQNAEESSSRSDLDPSSVPRLSQIDDNESIAASGDPRASWVDEPSDSSSFTVRGILNNIFEDSNDELDLELDF